MNILVTGACGFIGSHLVEKLVKRVLMLLHSLFIMQEDQMVGWIILTKE